MKLEPIRHAPRDRCPGRGRPKEKALETGPSCRRWLVASLLVFLAGGGCTDGVRDLDDQEFAEVVVAEISFDQALPVDRLQVTTTEGVVTLEGTVDHLLPRERVERIAETVKGLRSVVNLIETDPPMVPTDSALEQEVMGPLLRDPATDSHEIRVSARDGVISLAGTVESLAERGLCERVAAGVVGVVNVDNEIAVDRASERADEEIQREVQRALRSDVLVDDALLTVEVEKGQVILEGVVGIAAERRRAREDARIAGVESVDNREVVVARWARDEDLRTGKYLNIDDEEITEAIQLAFRTDPRIREGEIGKDVVRALDFSPYLAGEDDIVAEVTERFVTLDGEVQTHFRRTRADDISSRVRGVRGVINNLSVVDERKPFSYDSYLSRFDARGLPGYRQLRYTSTIPDEVIQESIEREIFWSPFVNSDEITVSVADGVATLSGTADPRREKDDATENAFEGGASWVEDELVVVQQTGGTPGAGPASQAGGRGPA